MPTKKIFESVAASVAREFSITAPEHQFTVRMVAASVAAAFAAENPRFDREKFMVACGVRG